MTGFRLWIENHSVNVPKITQLMFRKSLSESSEKQSVKMPKNNQLGWLVANKYVIICGNKEKNGQKV